VAANTIMREISGTRLPPAAITDGAREGATGFTVPGCRRTLRDARNLSAKCAKLHDHGTQTSNQPPEPSQAAACALLGFCRRARTSPATAGRSRRLSRLANLPAAASGRATATAAFLRRIAMRTSNSRCSMLASFYL
jgi:hypothetical protein